MKRSDRRWFRFSLKTFLVVTTAVCILLAVAVKRAHDRRSAIAAIDAWGGGYTIDLLGPDWMREYVRNNKWFYNLSRVSVGPRLDDYDAGNPFDDQALQRLIPYLNRFSNFRKLDVRGTAVTDQGLSHLDELNFLDEILLNETRISDAGLKVLADIGTLTRIDIRETMVTPQGIAKFQAALPNCEVRWDGE